MLKMDKDGIDGLLAHHTREAQHARGAARCLAPQKGTERE